MEQFKVNEESIKPFFAGTKRHKHYFKALDEYFHMDFHFSGYFVPPIVNDVGILQPEISFDKIQRVNPYFARLIDARRPSESDQIKTYRRIIYLPESKSPCHKVYGSLKKITDSNDWKPDYKDVAKPASIADDEYLEDYCEKNYPEFDSVKNWFSSLGLKDMLVDSNGLIFVLPKDFEIKGNEYFKPVATIINCEHVYGFKENEYAVFHVDREYEYKSGNGWRKGKCLGIITKEGYSEARQISGERGFELIEVFKFKQPMKYLPAWLIGGVIEKKTSETTLYNSFLSPMLPGLDGMAMAISDEDAEWVQHVYSTMWYFSNQDCNHCQGKGKVKGKGQQLITCTECNGQGNAPKSPYRDMVLKSGTFDTEKMPSPPAGYIQKQTEIVKAFEARVNKKEYRALSSVNHEFLAEMPLVNSGIAKQFDRQELTQFVKGVAKHSIKNVIAQVYYFINEFRYSEAVKNDEERAKMLPKFPVPEDFDLITANILEAQLKALNEAKADPNIIDEVELEYAAKSFPNNTDLRDRMVLKKALDPFPRITPEQKSQMILDGSADKIDVIVSNYLNPFIELALFENEDFCEMELDKQKEVIYKYAEDKMKSLDAAQKIKDKAAKAAGTDPKTGQPYAQ